MQVRLPNIEVPKENPFEFDRLNRSGCAKNLTTIIDSTKEGCVLAINGEWGSGKTTFINMWSAQLIKDGYKTLYFNVWENDFLDDPLVGLLGVIYSQLPKSERVKSWIGKASTALAKVGLAALPSVANAAIKHFTGVDVEHITKDALKETSDIIAKNITEYKDKTDSIIEFRSLLKTLVEEESPETPLVFFVDELDRCNPAFSVKVLERIKHLFSVPNVVFVLSVDKEQLCHSIRGYYGSEQINAEEYLKRFIDIEYKLPQPNANNFCIYLYNHFSFGQFFKAAESWPGVNRDEHEFFTSFTCTLFKHNKLNLRAMEKIFSHTRLAVTAMSVSNAELAFVLFLLIYFQQCEPEFYKKLKRHQLNISDFVSEFSKLFPTALILQDDNYNSEQNALCLGMCILIHAMSIEKGGQTKTELFRIEDNKFVLNFDCGLFYNQQLGRHLNAIKDDRVLQYRCLDDIIEYVEFVNGFNHYQ